MATMNLLTTMGLVIGVAEGLGDAYGDTIDHVEYMDVILPGGDEEKNVENETARKSVDNHVKRTGLHMGLMAAGAVMTIPMDLIVAQIFKRTRMDRDAWKILAYRNTKNNLLLSIPLIILNGFVSVAASKPISKVIQE